MSPQVTWKFEVPRRTVIDAGQRGDRVLRQALLICSDVAVGGGDTLAKDGEYEKERRASQADEQPAQRNSVQHATAPSFQVANWVGWEGGVVVAELSRPHLERVPLHGRRERRATRCCETMKFERMFIRIALDAFI